ncbi:JmjC domain-containing protein [Xylona heveae TC161]|uniref:JmjC domain-containing protein n=1 Tax=Xylona heveae (strain CBS 132557 / TC161) TaxID=1328760 RepID=A0A165J8N4_XYLHT|nr:JmjC domain-containing protein [Xylona heveae TC161]KZF25899.1 JmjC domain-containing protein [Xylona heveae TC161]
MSPSVISPEIQNQALNGKIINLPSHMRQDLIDEPDESGEKPVTIPQHPLGIKPAGNAYVARYDMKTACGNFYSLADELIIQILENLDAKSLTRLGATCKALYAFSTFEELWKTLFIESPREQIQWHGTWRATYFANSLFAKYPVDCSYLFSDALHRPFFCAHTPLTPYVSNIPARNQIARLSNLTAAEFSAEWTDRPFILTEPVREWPVYHRWSVDGLNEQYGDVEFRAEAVDWPMRSYIEYMKNSSDESPLYLFDRGFVEKMKLKVGKEEGADYWIPGCFGEDLFAVLGDQRPDSRWLIVGPERSGSTFHKDPNATSAWNAVIRGSKYWIMFPNTSTLPPPPGVFVSEDQSEVTSPLSIAEWLLSFHAEARRTKGCLEGICQEGEVLHVPSGWWHLVVNLTPSIAITQNFIPRAHLSAALGFLKDKADQVSGFKTDVSDPFETFVQKMRERHPEVLEEGLQELEKLREKKKRKWDEVVKNDSGDSGENGGGFSFGFGGDDDEEIP